MDYFKNFFIVLIHMIFVTSLQADSIVKFPNGTVVLCPNTCELIYDSVENTIDVVDSEGADIIELPPGSLDEDKNEGEEPGEGDGEGGEPTETNFGNPWGDPWDDTNDDPFCLAINCAYQGF